MAGHNTANMNALIRAEVWSEQLRKIYEDELMADKFVDWIPDFMGTQLTIPSIGQFDAQDYTEDQAIQYQALDTGEWNMTITEYKHVATYITNKAKQDLYYADVLEGAFVPKMARAIREDLESKLLREGQPKTGADANYQTAGATNNINGYNHRRVGSTSSNSTYVMGLKDFAYAKLALKKANMPLSNLVAIVDPHVAYLLETTSELTNVSNNPRWEGIIETGLTQDKRFIRNVYGFDVYESNYLPKCGTDQTGTAETINSVSSGTDAVCNILFSAAQDVLPFKGVWKQMPKVDGEYNKDFQREEYVTTARYGCKIYQPKNLITFLSNPSGVA